MARLTTADIVDELVNPAVTSDDLDEADRYLDDLAQSYGYALADIPTPLPYKVKKLAINVVCRDVCVRKMGAGSDAFRGQERGDMWGDKLKYFKEQVEILEAAMTEDVLLGNAPGSTFGAIELERG